MVACASSSPAEAHAAVKNYAGSMPAKLASNADRPRCTVRCEHAGLSTCTKCTRKSAVVSAVGELAVSVLTP